jgi:hypothetical protein
LQEDSPRNLRFSGHQPQVMQISQQCQSPLSRSMKQEIIELLRLMQIRLIIFLDEGEGTVRFLARPLREESADLADIAFVSVMVGHGREGFRYPFHYNAPDVYTILSSSGHLLDNGLNASFEPVCCSGRRLAIRTAEHLKCGCLLTG